MEKFKGTLVECIKDFSRRIQGNFVFRNTICRILEAHTETGHRWFTELVTPVGKYLLKMYLLLELNGYEVNEVEALNPDIREFGRLIALGAANLQDAQAFLAYGNKSGALNVAIGRTNATEEKLQKIKSICAKFRPNAAAKLKIWKENLVLDSENLAAPLITEATAKTVAKVVDRVMPDFTIKTLKEAEEKVELIKHLMLALETGLRYFRDGTKESRDAFRKLLNPSDIGYISSLLGMLGDEDRFQRWLELSTYRFRQFKK